MPRSLLQRRARGLICGLAAGLILMACTGPETGDDHDPTPTPTATPTATATATATATSTFTPTATATLVPTATLTPTTEPSPTITETRVPTGTTTPAASTTGESSELSALLPTLSEVTGQGWTVASQGTHTAQELAMAYADPAAHLQRLQDWGFKAHVYREFTRTSTGDGDTTPVDLLATINEYGSPDQADAAFAWLKGLGLSQGAQEADAPKLGDAAVALTVPTSSGVPTASIYVRVGSRVFVYFAEGGDPLSAVTALSNTVFQRIS